MAISSEHTITQVDCTNGTPVDEESKLTPKLLKKISRHTDKRQFEIMMFLAKGLRLRAVSKADSVSSLYRALESGCATRETAVVVLQHLLDKALVDRECTRQLTSRTHDIAELRPRLYFREMLLRVSEEMESDDFVRFCDTVEHKLEANLNNFKNPLDVFERLIEVGALKVLKESVEQLEQWLVDSGRQNIAQEIVRKYRETQLEHSEPELVHSESYTDDASEHDGAAETDTLLQGDAENNTSVGQHPRDGNTPPPERGQSCWKTCFFSCICICLTFALVIAITSAILAVLYASGKLFTVPSDRDVFLYNDKPLLAFDRRINTFKSREASLTVIKGNPYEGAVIVACTFPPDSKQQYIQSRAINYTRNLMSSASEVRWIAKLGNASDPVDKFEYIIDGTLNYSLELVNNTNRTDLVTLSFFDSFVACRKFADDDVTGHTDMNGVSCTRSNTTSVVTYACDFSTPAYRCAVWTVPSYTNFSYSTNGRIRHYSLGGANGSDHRNCDSHQASKGHEITVPLTDSSTAFSKESQYYLLVTLSNADAYVGATVTVHLNINLWTYAFFVVCGVLGLAVIAVGIFLVLFLWRCLLSRGHKPAVV